MFDIRVIEVQEKGSKVYAILTPKSEAGSYPTPANFASVLGYFVERYDMDGVNDMPGLLEPVLYWEIVNEYQSSAPEWSGLSQATYVQYCQLSRTALKAANPGAKFSAGSLVCGDMHDFSDFKAVWTAGVQVDFISYHSYLPDKLGMKDATDDLWTFDPNLQKVPFVITESAFYDNPQGVSASQYKNARWLPIACSNAFYYNAERVIYAELTANSMWSDPRLLWMTMIDKDGVKRPNYYTFLKMNRSFGNFFSVKKVSGASESFNAFRYLNPDSSNLYCAWTDKSEGDSYSISNFETRKFKKVCAIPDIDASDNVILDANGYPTFESQILVKTPGALSFSSSSDVPYYILPVHGNLKGDFDGNGKDDILSLDSSNYGRVLLMNGKSISSKARFYSTNNGNWGIKKICDFDGDGKSDLLWEERNTRKYAIYLMNGANVTSAVAFGTANSGWNVLDCGDFDADGKSDLLWEHSNGKGVIWLMNGLAVKSHGFTYKKADANWNIVKIADFNADQKADLLWEHSSSGQGVIYLMNGISPSAQALIYTKTDPELEPVTCADFNGDNKDDILFENKATRKTSVFLMNGTTVSDSGTVYDYGADWKLICPMK